MDRDDLDARAAMLLQDVDNEMQKYITEGQSVYEAQFRALYERQLQYALLSPEWRWFQPRVEGAYHTLQQFEQAAVAIDQKKARRTNHDNH